MKRLKIKTLNSSTLSKFKHFQSISFFNAKVNTQPTKISNKNFKTNHLRLTPNHPFTIQVRLAEWSKALVLRANDIKVAWVRIPHLTQKF